MLCFAVVDRFMNGCDQDVREARRRWDITRKWRQDEGINDILSECSLTDLLTH